jgi:predicted RNA-binding Zn-ribbon protein involved in translation (DUF1610 family)
MFEQPILVKCDNQKCNYKIPNPTKDIGVDLTPYVNMPCPKCGENLLTEKDYKKYNRTAKVIRFIVKYFSWVI